GVLRFELTTDDVRALGESTVCALKSLDLALRYAAPLPGRDAPAGPCPSGDMRNRFVWQKTGGRCFYCGEPAEVPDHVLAVSHGGADTVRNMVPACDSCNSRKGDRTVHWFRGFFFDGKFWAELRLNRADTGS